VPPLFGRTISLVLSRMSAVTDPTSFTQRPLGPGEELALDDMRIKFKVQRDFSKHPNNCEIEVYNLAPQTRHDLEQKPLSVRLAAGYGGFNRLLFIGDVTFAQSEIDGTEWCTLLQLGDGSRTFAQSRVSAEYKRGTTYRTVLTSTAKSMGLTLPPALLKDAKLDTKFSTGHTAYGPAQEELTKLLAPFGYFWSMQNGVLRVLKGNETVSGESIVLSEENGMIGTPEFGSPPKSGKPPHVTVKLLLYPELAPGDKATLKSRAKSGSYRIDKVEHSGDTHSSDWHTSVEIKPG